jgi:hypothetical protein
MTTSSNKPRSDHPSSGHPLVNKAPSQPDNPFDNMGMIRFWVLSTLFYLTFPASLLFSHMAFGPRVTKQLIRALINDFLQTVLVALVVLAILIWAVIQFVVPYIGSFFTS